MAVHITIKLFAITEDNFHPILRTAIRLNPG